MKIQKENVKKNVSLSNVQLKKMEKFPFKSFYLMDIASSTWNEKHEKINSLAKCLRYTSFK